LSEARGWGTPWASRGEVEALDRAYRHRERLPTDARTLVVASVLDKNGDLAVIDTMEAYVSRNPFDAEGWYVLADVRFHAQKVVPAERDELYGPFDRALELSPTMTRALIHPLQLAALENDSIRYARYLEHFREVAGDPGQLAEWPEVLWGPEEAASRTLVRLLSTTSRSPRAPFIQALAAWGNLSADRVLGAFEEAAGRLASGGERDRLSFAHDWASALITYGRLEELERPLAWIRPRDAGGAAVVTIEAAVAGVGAVPGLDEAVRHLETEGPADSAAVWLSGLELSRGQVSAGRGRIEAALSEGGLPPDSPFRALLRAHRGWAVALRGDTATGLDEMDEALQRVGYGLSAALAHHARLELMVPRPHGRDRAIDLLRRTWGDVEFLAPRALLLGRALEMEGRSEEARRAYADALRLWETADPALRALLDPARA
ncbi:MAG: hypothetical protein GWM92_06915, partial [Gemmatimonadetes bacterium]|nr:hypothetical protein [Gemmatimonadota bacterium]NIR78359.1 hypothetical protein [Gemmatimonadota bacterium]NIT86952.1 hypothetical protein [Gemmatimonadota bacterium]NIU30799.1 hypothetical protein [Gemmatimonadota bacterium]NIU35581.1 hypothetical protein [Gemmatimonadota bacterium]